jgi:SH3-like domain-containing protein
MSRRKMFGLIAGAGVAVASGSIATATSGVTYTTTNATNLLTEPDASSMVITTLGPGEIVVDYDNEIVNGFRSVDAYGNVGWVPISDLVEGGSDDPTPPDPVIIGGARTTADVNFRSAPNSGDNVIEVVAAGTWVDISATVQNGYRLVVYNGQAGWISDAYLGGDDEGAFVTTAEVSLHSGPDASYPVVLELPAGATVVDYVDEIVNGFRHVDYQGTTGWVSTAYLAKA